MKKILTTILLVLFLASCESSGSCINADDFGYPNIPVEVNGGTREKMRKYPHDPALSWYQVSWSTSTGHVLSGKADLKISLEGAWSPWDARDGLDTDGYEYDDASAKQVPVDNSCGIDEFDQFTSAMNGQTGLANSNLTTNIEPCFFTEGIGIYIGFSKHQDSSVVNYYHFANPQYFSKSNRGWYFTMPLSDLQNIRDELDLSFSNIKVYVKLEHYSYGDNINGCLAKDVVGNTIFNSNDPNYAVFKCNTPPSLLFLSGVRPADGGFLQAVVNYVIDPFESMVSGVYASLVGNDFISNTVNLLAALFITYLGIAYFLGLTDYTNKTLMTLIVKFSIVFTLMTPNIGWSYYQYFVTFFWEGSQELALFVADSINQGALKSNSDITIDNASAGSSILMPLDNILEALTSNSVQRKMTALIFSHELGLLFYLLVVFTIMVFFFSAVQVAVVIVNVYVVMAMMLALGPIFITMLVLPYTKKYFDKWVETLIGTMLQPMLLITFISFFATIITDYIQRLLYFRACFYTLFRLPWFDVGFWQVDKNDVWSFDDDTQAFVEADLETVVSFHNLFVLLLFSIFMKYMVEKVPDVCDKLAAGISFSSMTAGARKMVRSAQDYAESGAAAIGKHTILRQFRNGGLFVAARAAGGLSYMTGGAVDLRSFVPGTAQHSFRKAKEQLINDKLANFWTREDVEKMLNAPSDPNNPAAIGGSELEQRFRQVSAEAKYKYGSPLTSLERIYSDGLMGNARRAQKAITGHFNYQGARRRYIERRKKRDQRSGYQYGRKMQFDKAFKSTVEDQDFIRKRGNEFSEIMEAKVKSDFRSITDDKLITRKQLEADSLKQLQSDTPVREEFLRKFEREGYGDIDRAIEIEAQSMAIARYKELEEKVEQGFIAKGYSPSSAKQNTKVRLAAAFKEEQRGGNKKGWFS